MLVEAVDRRGLLPPEYGSTAAWLRDTYKLSPGQASRDVKLARTLVDVLPLVLAALAVGDIDIEHARLVASLRRVITDDALRQVERHLVALARERSPHELRGVIAHVKHAYAPDRGVKDDQELHAQRELNLATTYDGAGVGRWLLDPAGQETVATAIHALSAPTADDDRSAAQRRADALVTVCEMALKSGQLPITGGVKPQVSLILSAPTLFDPATARPLPDRELSLDQIEAELRERGVTLTFGQVISPVWARRFTCDAAISRIVFGPANEILNAGRTIRTFTAAQIRAITARDRHCIWPGCDLPAPWAEAHHINHWADGGATDVDNGVLLCGRHHDRVHLYGHAIVKKPDGRYTVDIRKASDPNWHGHQRAGP